MKKGNATQINDAHPALVAILDYLRKHSEVDGRKLLDDFGRAPFGWFKDTTRYLVAALLIAGKIRIRVGSQWIKAAGEKSLEALKNNKSFEKVDIAPNDEVVSQETRLLAAKRLLDVTGQQILPMPQNISRGVQENFPIFQRDYASLSAEIASAGLPGSDRADRLQKQLSQILQGDASEAPTVLGAEECDLIDNLIWAREVRKAFEQKVNETAILAGSLLREIPRLPRIGAAELIINDSETVREELKGLLERDDFYSVAADIRGRLHSLEVLVKTGAEQLAEEFQRDLATQSDAIRSEGVWATLPEGDRATFSSELESLSINDANDLEGIRVTLNQKMEVDSRLNTIRTQVVSRAKAIEEAKSKLAEAAGQKPSATGGGSPRTSIKIRKKYESAEEVRPLIQELQTAVDAGKGIDLELE